MAGQGHLAKSLLTIQNAYSYESSTFRTDADRHSYDLRHTYLNKNEQIREYKRLLSSCKDMRDISFIIIGLSKLQNISIDYDLLKKTAIDIIVNENKNKSVGDIADDLGLSRTVIHKAISGFITSDIAISIVFIYNRDLIKEIIS